MRKDVVFGNAVCKAEEKNLLSREALLRLSAADFDEAVKMLHDYGYNEGIYSEGSFDIDSFIGRQVNLLIEFVKEYAPTNEVEDFLLAPYLFNNIKAEYKRKRGGTPSKLYETAGAEGIASGDYSGLDEDIRNVLLSLDRCDADAQKTDIALTKAQYAYRLKKAKKSGSKLLIRYVKAEIDIINISTAVRGQKLNIAQNELEELFIAGGNLDKPYDKSTELRSEYEDFDLKNLVKFETQADDYLLKTADGTSENLDSYGPLLSYVLRKISEFKTMKMILVCIKSDARSDISMRIRGLL